MRSFQSLRFGSSDITERHRAFVLLCEDENARATCTFNQIAEPFILRLGRLQRWSIANATALLANVLATVPALDSQNSITTMLVTHRFASIEKAKTGPFDGCAQCAVPCRFRFDVPSDAGATFSRAYFQSFSGPPENFKSRWKDDVVLPAVRSMRDLLPTSDDRVAKSAAYCFAVQNIALISSDANEVENAVRSFKDALD